MTRNHGLLLAGAVALVAAGVLVAGKSAPLTVTQAAPRSPLAQGNPSLPGTVNFKKSLRPAVDLPQALAELPPPVVSPHPAGSAENQEWIVARISELDHLAAYDDSESLMQILADLRNPLPEIRAAALAATQAFGSRDAIPALLAIAASSAEPAERKSLSEVAEFLKLPTLIEHLDRQEKAPTAGDAAPRLPDGSGGAASE
jgi:hypothetical protein